ncbi:hypothetical protein HPB52_015235 [Rhipicephalus sanguineus]|uniref:Peptidase M13 N-terminal domain-containing protein n=1 Tax=Rhipicephalus sanguineus TaxID=34632 RepID=A0A9D4PCK5_RHISA|nr:hypothetical protein HPB52_015235 [Rhipicephalus sanguineus]
MEGRKPSVARSSRSPAFPRCGQSRGAGQPPPVASSRKRSPKPSPRRAGDLPTFSRRAMTRCPSEDGDDGALPTTPPPTDTPERVAFVPAPKRPLRVATLAINRRQPLPTPRERHERFQQSSGATSSPPKKRAASRQRLGTWFRRDMGDSAYVAASAREAVEVDKSTAGLLTGADDGHGSPRTGEAPAVPAGRASGRPQVAPEKRGKRPAPRSSVQVYVDIQKLGKEKREDKSAGLPETGARGRPTPINEDSEMSPLRSGAGSEVSLTVGTSIQRERRSSLLHNITTSISTVLSRFFRNGAVAEQQPEPARRTGQAMRTERSEDIEAALGLELGANDETEATGRQGGGSARSRHHLDLYRGLAASGLSLTQIIRLPEGVELSAKPRRRSKAEPGEINGVGTELVELPDEPADHADMQQPPGRSKAERKESFADLPAVVEAHAEPAHQGEEKERRLSGKGIERDKDGTDTEGPHVSKVPDAEARRKSVGGKNRHKEKAGSNKDGEVSEVSSGAKGRRASESNRKIHQKKRKKSAPESDVTEKTIAESSEESESTGKRLRRKSSTAQGSARKASMMEQLQELPSSTSEGGRRKSHQRDRKKSRDDATEEVSGETEQSSPRKTGESRRKSSTAHGRKKENSRRGSMKNTDAQESGSPDSKRAAVPSKSPHSQGGDLLEDAVKSPEELGKSTLRTKSKAHVIPFERRLSTNSGSQRLAAALRKEDALHGDGLDSRIGSPEEATMKKTASLSSMAMISKSKSDGKKEGAESTASEDKRKKQHSKGSAESHATGPNREESAVAKEVSATTGGKKALGGGRASTKERLAKSKKKKVGAHKSRDKSSRDLEKQLVAIKETEQALATVKDHERPLQVHEEAGIIALPFEGGLAKLKTDAKAGAEPGTAPNRAHQRRRSRQAGVDKYSELKGDPSRAPSPGSDDGESGHGRKISLEKEGSRKVPQEAGGDGKTQEPGSPEGGNQDDEKSPKGKPGKAKGKSKGHAHKHEHKHGRKHHGHEHHKHKKRSRKGSDETATRCVETQTCLVSPIVEKGGASCRDFSFGVTLSPVISGTLRRPSDKKRSYDIRRPSKDVPEATKMASESPEPISRPTDDHGSKKHSKKSKKSKRHSKGSKRARKERKKRKSKVSGSPLSDVKPETVPQGDKPHKPPRKPEPMSKPLSDVAHTELGSDEGKKAASMSSEERVGDQSADKVKHFEHKSSKGRKSKRSKQGRKKGGKRGAHRDHPDAGESVPFRFGRSPSESRQLSRSTMATETARLLSPAEDIQAGGAGGVGGEDQKAGKDESPERSKGEHRSKKSKSKSSRRHGKHGKTSPHRGSGKRKFKRKSGRHGKRSSSKKKGHEKRSPEHGERTSSPEGPTAKEKGEEKAAVESKGEQGGRETDVDVSRRPVTEGAHEQQESVSPEQSKKSKEQREKSHISKSKDRRSKSSKNRDKRKKSRGHHSKSSKDKTLRKHLRTEGGASLTKELSPSEGRTKMPSSADSAGEGERVFDFDMSSRPVISGKYGHRETKKGTGQPEPKVSVSKSLKGGKRAREDKHRKHHGSRKSHGRHSKGSRKRRKPDRKKARDDDKDVAKSPSSSTAHSILTSPEERITPEKDHRDHSTAAAVERANGGGSRDFDFVVGLRPRTRGTLPRPDLTQIGEPAVVEAFERCQSATYVRIVRGHDGLATRAYSESPSAGDWKKTAKDRERKSRRHRTRSHSRRSKSKSSRRSKSKGDRSKGRSSKQSRSRRSSRSCKTHSRSFGSKRGRRKRRSRSKRSSSRSKKREKRRRRHRKDSRRRRRRHDRGGRRRRGRSRSARRRKMIRRLLVEEASRPSQAPALSCLLVTLLAFTAVLTLCVGVLYYYIIVVKPRHTTPETTTYAVIVDSSTKRTTPGHGRPTTRTTTTVTSSEHPLPPVPPTTGVYYCSTDYCDREAHYIGNILAGEMNPCDNFYQHVCARWKRQHFNEVPQHASFVSQETLLEESLAARFTADVAGTSQGDVRVASKLYGACADRWHRDNVSNRTMQLVFERWSIQEWPRTSPPTGGTSAVYRFAAELVRDLGLATLVGAGVSVYPNNPNVTLVELYQPRLLLHEASVESVVVRQFFTRAVDEATAYQRGLFMAGLNESLFKVHTALASLVHPSFGAADDSDDPVVRQVGQLGRGLTEFLQVLLADVRSQVSRHEKVLLRSKHYLLDQLDEKLKSVSSLDALNYMGLLAYIRVSPFLPPSDVPRLRLLFAETIMGRTLVDSHEPPSRFCARLTERTLPDCFAKMSQQWRQASNQDVAALEWLSQLESVFLGHVMDFVWMNELSSLLVRYRLKRVVTVQFGQLPGEQHQCAPTGSLNTENALLFFLDVTKRLQGQLFEGLLVNGSTLRHRLAASHSDLAGVATFERALRTIHVPAALFNVSVPINSSVFVFHLARVAVRLYRGLVQLLDDNPYEFETPLGLTDELRRRRADLVSCFAKDALRRLPARFGGTRAVERQLGTAFLEQTSALGLSVNAFDELLNVRRIWHLDLRFKQLPHMSARQLFFIYFALDNCADEDESIHWNRLPAEQLVNVPLRHTRQFAEAFRCRGGQDRMAASPGSEFCEVFRRHPRERRVWEAHRSQYGPVNGTPVAEGA